MFYDRPIKYLGYSGQGAQYGSVTRYKTYMPMINFSYYRDFYHQVQLGFRLSYWYSAQMLDIGHTATHEVLNFKSAFNAYFVEVQYKHYYYRFKNWGLFGKLSTGISLVTNQLTNLDSGDKSKVEVKPVFDIFLAPLGLEYGSNIGLHFNVGIGLNHIAELGLYYRF